jgi:glutamate/tyrosine decarboxylase-like PLP-dependent enzyme
VNGLAFDAVELERVAALVGEILDASCNGVRERSASPTAPVEAWGAEPPLAGSSAEVVIDEMRRRLLPQASLFHPRMFGYLTGANVPIAAVADLVASACNPNLAAPSGGPAATELERLTIRWLADLVAYPAADGVLTSGASTANLMALSLASASAAGPRLRRLGLQGLPADERLTLYAAESAHPSIERAAAVLHRGTDALALVAADAEGRMRPDALARALELDVRRGARPCCIVATAGTSTTGVVDPLPELGVVARRFRTWLHVDGAYGAFARLSPRTAARLPGLERADSVSLDPHKWLGVPYDAGCLLVRRPGALGAVFGRTKLAPLDGFLSDGIEESRRLRALKIWATVMHLGVDELRRGIEECVRLADLARSLVDASPELELLARGDLATLVFRFAAASEDVLDDLNARTVEIVNGSGEAFALAVRADGCTGLRMSITNFRTTEADVRWFLSFASSVARGLARDLRVRPPAVHQQRAG